MTSASCTRTVLAVITAPVPVPYLTKIKVNSEVFTEFFFSDLKLAYTLDPDPALDPTPYPDQIEK